VFAIERYVHEHPQSQIQSEVAAALRVALLTELEQAKRAGTVTALGEFESRHPDSKLVEPELRQARHAVYLLALARYRRFANAREPAGAAFVEHLLSFAERRGPQVLVRFRRKVAPSVDRADAQIAKSPFFMGTTSYPSRYFDDAHARSREAPVGQAIVQRFADVFPADVLSLEVGPPVASTEDLAAPLTVPTLFVEHWAEMSGAGYMNLNPRAIFVGAGMMFEAAFRIPEEPKPFRLKTSAWKTPDLIGLSGESPEGKVYEAMATDAFSQFTKKLVSSFFKANDDKP
jgi:hypothetical protein